VTPLDGLLQGGKIVGEIHGRLPLDSHGR